MRSSFLFSMILSVTCLAGCKFTASKAVAEGIIDPHTYQQNPTGLPVNIFVEVYVTTNEKREKSGGVFVDYFYAGGPYRGTPCLQLNSSRVCNVALRSDLKSDAEKVFHEGDEFRVSVTRGVLCGDACIIASRELIPLKMGKYVYPPYITKGGRADVTVTVTPRG